MQQATSNFLQRANFCNEQLLQRVTSEFCKKWRVNLCNEQLLQRVTSEFCNQWRVILQQATSSEWISTSNEQRVKSYFGQQHLLAFIFSKIHSDSNNFVTDILLVSKKAANRPNWSLKFFQWKFLSYISLSMLRESSWNFINSVVFWLFAKP